MGSSQAKVDQLILEIYSTNFENAEHKIQEFERNNLEIMSDFELRQMFDYLKVQVYEHLGNIQGALDLAIEVWKKYPTSHQGYLTTALHIVQLMTFLGKVEAASKFVEDSVLSIPINNLKNLNPIIIARMLPAYIPMNSGYFGTIKAAVSHIEDELGFNISLDQDNPVQSLKEVANRIQTEGKQLTEILATRDIRSPKQNIEALTGFLTKSKVRNYRTEAQNLLDHLQQSS
jgi:hypothetical protein